MSSIELFHLLRPWVLILFLPAWSFVWWLLRQQNDSLQWKKLVNPRLLSHLLVKPNQKASKLSAPWHLGIVWTLIILALSGPSLQLKPSPFTQDSAEVVFVMKVTQSMETQDLMPSRLKRSVLKMKDIMDSKEDMKMSLIAYSGSAHLVLPMTKDHAILNTFAQALDSKIMPSQGDDLQVALELAQKQFSSSGGTIIVFADIVNAQVLKNLRLNNTNVILFSITSSELADTKGFEKAASLLDGEYIQMTADDQDVISVVSHIDSAFKQAGKNDNSRYQDQGYLLLPFIVLLMLLWFRSGFIAEAWRIS